MLREKELKKDYRYSHLFDDIVIPDTSKIVRNKRYHQLKNNGNYDSSITLAKLIERDNGICKICLKIVNEYAHPYENIFPSIDHKTPVSKGGQHTWDNVQLAHRGCNIRKSNMLFI